MRDPCNLILAILLSSGSAVASACTQINTAPYTIGAPGAYCLGQDLTVDVTQGKPAILIEADSVDLDLSGYSINALSSGNGMLSHGVYARARHRVRVHSGQIHGFYYGVALTDDVFPTIGFVGNSYEHEVSGLKISESGIGIFIVGRSSVIGRNVIVDSRYAGISYHGNAIAASNPDIRYGGGTIESNEIYRVDPPAGFSDPVHGINSSGYKSLITRNWVARILGPAGSPSSAIRVTGQHNQISDNQQSELSNAHGVFCTSLDNVVINNLADVPSAVVGCTIQ
jgi:hypothetical protein